MGFLFLNNATSKNRHGNQLDNNQETVEMYTMGILLFVIQSFLSPQRKEKW